MLTTALLALVLAAPCPPEGTVITPPDIGKAGFGFVMEISGSVIDRMLAQLADSRVERALADGGKIEIVLDRVVADAYAPCGTDLRIIVNATVRLDSAGCVRRSRATIMVGAKLKVQVEPGRAPSLEIEPAPEAIIVTDDSAQAAEVERAILETGPELAAKLATSTPLGGLEALAQASPGGPGAVIAAAYNLGFAWVLQVGGALGQGQASPPQVFQQGDLLTLVLTRETVSRLASYEYAAGHLPSQMTREGLVDPHGPVRITGLSADIEPDALLVDWHGVTEDSRIVLIRWRLGFVSTPSGLALEIREITVDGKPQEVPKHELINPIDDLIKTIATGPKRTGLLAGPIGRMKLTTGRISAEAVLVAGRV